MAASMIITHWNGSMHLATAESVRMSQGGAGNLVDHDIFWEITWCDASRRGTFHEQKQEIPEALSLQTIQFPLPRSTMVLRRLSALNTPAEKPGLVGPCG